MLLQLYLALFLFRFGAVSFRSFLALIHLPSYIAQDTIFEEHLIMLRGSSVDLVADLFREGKVGGKDGNKATVGTQFQKSLT